MSLYDDYFTNDDKPFAENFNDALLLSNVFDLTVPIELPRMFNNGEWSTGTGQRKAGVSIIQTEGIDGTDVAIDTYEDEQGDTVCELFANVNTTVLITVYPNFNQYGNLQKVYWEFVEGLDENLTVDVLTEQRTVLLTNIPNNSVLSSVPYLQQLNRFILRLNFEGGTGIRKLGFIMQNKQQERYGAEVGINDVNGLEDDLNSLESDLSSLNSNVTQKINNLNTEVWGSNTQTGNSRIDTLNTNYNTLRSSITNLESSVASLDTRVNNFYVGYAQVVQLSSSVWTGGNNLFLFRMGNLVVAFIPSAQLKYTSTGWKDMATLPTGYRPIMNTPLAVINNSTETFQQWRTTNNVLQVYCATANSSVYTGCLGVWVTSDDTPTQ